MNLAKEFLLLKAKVDKLYCQLIAKSPDEQDPTVPNHVKTIKQEDIDNWNNVKEEEVQITEDTVFAQIGQTQKDFNKSVSDYKTSSDLKNQEQDNRLSDIEGENVAQNDLINGLQADLDNQIAINANQDERIVNLEGINYIWSPTNRTLTLFDREGNQLSQVSLVSLDNEGTDLRYNASTLSLELYNADNQLLDSIPVSSFIGSVGTQLQLNSNQLQLKDNQGNILSTVSFAVSNIQGLQTALDNKENISNKQNNLAIDGTGTKYPTVDAVNSVLNNKLDKGTYTGTAQDLKNDVNGKLSKPTTTSTTTSYPFVVGEDGNGNSARLPAGDLGKNFFNSDLSNTTARNHTMNAGITVNTLGNPHTLSGLPNKNTDIANFRKVRVQNTSGLDGVVDSKNLLTDGVTSMTDAEKDAWRAAQRKTNETYSTSAPRIDYILPFVIKRENAIQYIMLQGINLYVNPATTIIKIVNTVTLQEYDVLTNSITVYANDYNSLQFSFNFSTVPVGTYKIKLVNSLVQNIDNTSFDVVDSINSIPINCTWETIQNNDSVFNSHTAPIITNFNSIYQKCAIVNYNSHSELTIAEVSKSSLILTQSQSNMDWIITLDITHNKNNSYWGGWFVGLMKSSIGIDLLNNIDFGYGRSGNRYSLIPLSNINTFISTDSILYEKLIIVKTGLKITLFWINGSTTTLVGTTTLFENINSDVSLVLKTYGSIQFNDSYYPSDVQIQISSIVLK